MRLVGLPKNIGGENKKRVDENSFLHVIFYVKGKVSLVGFAMARYDVIKVRAGKTGHL